METSAFSRGRVSKWMSSKNDLLPQQGLYPGFETRAVPMPANSCPCAWLHLWALWSLLLRSCHAQQLLALSMAALHPTYLQSIAVQCHLLTVQELAHLLQPPLGARALPKKRIAGPPAWGQLSAVRLRALNSKAGPIPVTTFMLPLSNQKFLPKITGRWHFVFCTWKLKVSCYKESHCLPQHSCPKWRRISINRGSPSDNSFYITQHRVRAQIKISLSGL